MNDYSRLSSQELVDLYARKAQEGDSAALEALEAEVQRRINIVREGLSIFTKRFIKAVKHVFQAAGKLLNVTRAPFLIQQYEKEIQRVERLLKYTRHSKKRQKHEQYLKRLRKQLERLANDSTNDNIIDNISAITINNINDINRCEEGGSV